MTNPDLHVPPEQFESGLILAQDPVDAEARQVASRQRRLERLTRLFRHVGSSVDDHHLLGIMRRYRESESS